MSFITNFLRWLGFSKEKSAEGAADQSVSVQQDIGAIKKRADELQQMIKDGRVQLHELDLLVAEGLNPEIVRVWKETYSREFILPTDYKEFLKAAQSKYSAPIPRQGAYRAVNDYFTNRSWMIKEVARAEKLAAGEMIGELKRAPNPKADEPMASGTTTIYVNLRKQREELETEADKEQAEKVASLLSESRKDKEENENPIITPSFLGSFPFDIADGKDGALDLQERVQMKIDQSRVAVSDVEMDALLANYDAPLKSKREKTEKSSKPISSKKRRQIKKTKKRGAKKAAKTKPKKR